MGVSGCGLSFVVHRVKGLGWKLQVAVWCWTCPEIKKLT